MTVWYSSTNRSAKRIVAKQRCLQKKQAISETRSEVHQMVKSAVTEAEKANADVIRCHTSSKSALNDILEKLK